MAIEYYFNNLDPVSFQRLINALLIARFGDNVRLLPLRGPDGGRDAETAPGSEALLINVHGDHFLPKSPRLHPGRYIFQCKHHRTVDAPISNVRNIVISDFERELKENVLPRSGSGRVNYFFLTTNVPSSKEAVAKIDEKRVELLAGKEDLHADVLWEEHVLAWLDQSPSVWTAFPDLFAGRTVPYLGAVAVEGSQGLPRSFRVAFANQFVRDGKIRFRQIELEQSLSKLFIDLDATVGDAVGARALQVDHHLPLSYHFEEGTRIEAIRFYNTRYPPTLVA